MRPDPDLDRRRVLALLGGAAGAVALGAEALAQRTQGRAEAREPRRAAPKASAEPAASPSGRFFTAPELQLVDELAELIIPADANSGGGRAAQVAAFIDARLGESLDAAVRQSWRDDLAEINRLSNVMFGRSFMATGPQNRVRLLERISRNERNPKEPGEFAFGTIKWQVTFVYYKTHIGIHDELKYQGNVLLDQFLGLDPSRT